MGIVFSTIAAYCSTVEQQYRLNSIHSIIHIRLDFCKSDKN